MTVSQEDKTNFCPPEACDTFQFMAKHLGLNVLHPGGLKETRRLLKQCKFSTRSKILDLGCGRGSTTILIAETFRCHVIGVDIDNDLLSAAKENTKKRNLDNLAEFRYANIENLPFEDNVFDGAIAQAVLVFTDKNKALREISRVIKPRGFIGVIELSWKKPPTEFIARRVKETLCSVSLEADLHEDWVNRMQKAGFQVVYTDLKDLKFSFINMLRDEGLLRVIGIIGGYFTRDTRERLSGFSRLFKETDKYLGYSVYVGRVN
jgi:ubiquinone/menaquinone biosynthesis C-methylase UbiE